MFKRPFELVERFSGRIPMGPRKKSKPNLESESHEQPSPPAASNKAAQTPLALTSSSEPGTESRSGPKENTSVELPITSLRAVSASPASQSSPQLVSNGSLVQKNMENRSSWYGTWKGKAKPVAEVATQSAPANPVGRTSRAVSQSTPRLPLEGKQMNGPAVPSPRRYMSGSMRQKSKADVLPASTSNLSVQSGNAKDIAEVKAKPVEPPKEASSEPPLPPNPSVPHVGGDTALNSTRQQSLAGGWFGGWWSRPDGYEEKQVITGKKEAENKLAEDAKQRPLPDSPAEERSQRQVGIANSNASSSETVSAISNQQEESSKQGIVTGLQRGSWFWSWSSQQNTQQEEPSASSGAKVVPAGEQTSPQRVSGEPRVSNTVVPPVQSISSALQDVDGKKDSAKKSGGWAFWSKEVTYSNDVESVHKQIGEIAVADTPSQSKPEAAQFNESSPQAEEPPKPKNKAASLRGRTKPTATQSEPATPAKSTPAGSPERDRIEPKIAAVAGKPNDEQPKQTKAKARDDKNILLPDFANTYSILQEPSIWQRIQRMFISDSHNFPGPHLHLTSSPPRIKKALAIGIHGFFPSPLYQKILGQPTGTSIRFANCAAQAIKSWTEGRGYECEIEKVALEGEGLIDDRVDTLWKLLLNWIDHIREADFILVAAHSQGVPVAAMLVAKLIQFGVGNARIGICAMAGISLGPFAEYKTRIFGGSALELFDFTDPKSKVSEAYRAAVQEVLKAGVRIVYVGSIDDQLVSLDSSTFSPASHPNIYRAVFIDGRLHTSDFLSQLIGFAFKLRNLGLPDHGLIRELSPALAGSLYTGEGHSSLHHYMPIYDLAVRHALETVPSETSTSENVRWGELKAPAAVKDQNPYFLPWALRGVLEEEAVRRGMGDEVEELLRTFEEWRPTSKGLKDVRFRLEAVRSKL